MTQIFKKPSKFDSQFLDIPIFQSVDILVNTFLDLAT